ncbi:TPR end-of-group domain-containing protein [Myxosarcina sp. GI1(2024)]
MKNFLTKISNFRYFLIFASLRQQNLSLSRRKATGTICYDRALELAPQSFWAWYKRAEMCRHLGNYAEALTSYQSALSLDAEDDYAWYNQGCCAAQLGYVSLAIECLQRAIELNQSNRQLIKSDRDLEPLRNTEEWWVLIEALA